MHVYENQPMRFPEQRYLVSDDDRPLSSELIERNGLDHFEGW
jgi:hypothetical protein